MERLSRQTLTVALPDGYDAHRTADAVAGALSRQPRHMVKTLTWDQGREMARWQHVENATGAKVYFCEPRSPWQRPHQRANQRPSQTLAAQSHRPQHSYWLGPVAGAGLTHDLTDPSGVFPMICRPVPAAGRAPTGRADVTL